jgi:hypothetical protein
VGDAGHDAEDEIGEVEAWTRQREGLAVAVLDPSADVRVAVVHGARVIGAEDVADRCEVAFGPLGRGRGGLAASECPDAEDGGEETTAHGPVQTRVGGPGGCT